MTPSREQATRIEKRCVKPLEKRCKPSWSLENRQRPSLSGSSPLASERDQGLLRLHQLEPSSPIKVAWGLLVLPRASLSACFISSMTVFKLFTSSSTLRSLLDRW